MASPFLIDRDMHVHYHINMRTTIEISPALRQKLMNEAAQRNLKGFSRIISDALEEYFQKEGGKDREKLRSLRGSLSKEEYSDFLEEQKTGRARWRM